ncbi:MAG: flagellar hook assembly protein FlgD [Tagaea sp.]|nr:flagellar hook assembly protein FlgD [Tagaea sp.]
MSGSISSTSGGNTTSTSAAQGSAAAASATFGKNFDTFLRLLTTQLQNQDPLSPMDTTQFTQQLVQFSSVEQSIRQNQNLETLIAYQKNAQSSSAVSYIGKTVEMSGDKVGVVGGQGTITYQLPEAANRTIINIFDKDGKMVTRLEGTSRQGDNAVDWNGRSDTGAQLPDGDYKVEIVASDFAGRALRVNTALTGTVTDVHFVDGSTLLTVNGVRLPLSQLTAVRGTPSI